MDLSTYNLDLRWRLRRLCYNMQNARLNTDAIDETVSMIRHYLRIDNEHAREAVKYVFGNLTSEQCIQLWARLLPDERIAVTRAENATLLRDSMGRISEIEQNISRIIRPDQSSAGKRLLIASGTEGVFQVPSLLRCLIGPKNKKKAA